MGPKNHPSNPRHSSSTFSFFLKNPNNADDASHVPTVVIKIYASDPHMYVCYRTNIEKILFSCSVKVSA